MTNIRGLLGELSPVGLRRLEKEIIKDLRQVRERRTWMAQRERDAKAIARRISKLPPSPVTAAKLAMAERNIRMVRLAMRGWTDQRIADRFGLSRQYVNRIIRRQLAGQLRDD